MTRTLVETLLCATCVSFVALAGTQVGKTQTNQISYTVDVSANGAVTTSFGSGFVKQDPDSSAVPGIEIKPGTPLQRETDAQAALAAQGETTIVPPGILSRVRGFQKLLHQQKLEPFQLPYKLGGWTGTGAYRRVMTKPGFSSFIGTVRLPPCGAFHYHKPSSEGYVYIGGWGAGDSGVAYDAGFEHQAGHDKIVGYHEDEYAPFIRGPGFDGPQKGPAGNPRFACGANIAFQFYAKDSTHLILEAVGPSSREPNKNIDLKVTFHHPPNGWDRSGGGTHNGIMIKRSTSLAYSEPQTGWDRDGSYFGRTKADPAPRVHWDNLQVGRVDSQGVPCCFVPWDERVTYFYNLKSIVNDYPDASRVVHTCDTKRGCAVEDDAIYLHK